MIQVSKSTTETSKIATELSHRINSLEIDGYALVVALEGELGAGKTTFTQAFAKAVGIKDKLTSPTFVIMKRYLITTDQRYLYHIDAYRIKDYTDLENLGIRDIMNDPNNIVLIEWSDRVKEILPPKYITVHIDHLSKNQRKITIT